MITSLMQFSYCDPEGARKDHNIIKKNRQMKREPAMRIYSTHQEKFQKGPKKRPPPSPPNALLITRKEEEEGKKKGLYV